MPIQNIIKPVYARLDHPDAGGIGCRKRVTQCLFRHILYPVTYIKWEDEPQTGEDIVNEDNGNTRTWVTLKNVRFWWPTKVFSFWDEEGKRQNIEDQIYRKE